MTLHQKHIVVLPRWYPNKTDIQLGIFIQRQLILLKDDFKFTVIYVQALEKQERLFLEETTQQGPYFTERVIYFRSAKGPFRKITNFIRFNRAQKIGMRKIEGLIDAFHVQVPYRTALPALRAYRKFKTPFFITEHWSGHLNGLFAKKNRLDKILYRQVLKRAAKISTVSSVLQANFKRNTGFDSILIPNIIERNSARSERLQTPSTIINILTVGDIVDEIKNQTSLIIALKISLLTHKNLRLTIIGGGPDENEIKKLAKDLDIPEKNLVFTGRQKHEYVLKAMNDCDFYICNSRFETFGMTVAEALLCGKPVISTRCGGPEEFLTEDNSLSIAVNGSHTDYLVPHEFASQTHVKPGAMNYLELSEAINLMATTYKNYNSSKISTEIESKFGCEAVREKWLSFFNN